MWRPLEATQPAGPSYYTPFPPPTHPRPQAPTPSAPRGYAAAARGNYRRQAFRSSQHQCSAVRAFQEHSRHGPVHGTYSRVSQPRKQQLQPQLQTNLMPMSSCSIFILRGLTHVRFRLAPICGVRWRFCKPRFCCVVQLPQPAHPVVLAMGERPLDAVYLLPDRGPARHDRGAEFFRSRPLNCSDDADHEPRF